MAKSIYREGAKFRVINPEVFVRCGYPETVESAIIKLKMEHLLKTGESIEKTLWKSIPSFGYDKDALKEDALGFKLRDKYDPDGYKQVVYQLGRIYLRDVLHFGGGERKLYTKTVERLDGEIVTYDGDRKNKVHKTGTYSKGWSGCDYWGEWDSEPTTLEDQKTHLLIPCYDWKSHYYIEKTNLEIIEE